MAERRWFGRVWECERRVSKKHRRDIACEALGTARVWVPRGLAGAGGWSLICWKDPHVEE